MKAISKKLDAQKLFETWFPAVGPLSYHSRRYDGTQHGPVQKYAGSAKTQDKIMINCGRFCQFRSRICRDRDTARCLLPQLLMAFSSQSLPLSVSSGAIVSCFGNLNRETTDALLRFILARLFSLMISFAIVSKTQCQLIWFGKAASTVPCMQLCSSQSYSSCFDYGCYSAICCLTSISLSFSREMVTTVFGWTCRKAVLKRTLVSIRMSLCSPPIRFVQLQSSLLVFNLLSLLTRPDYECNLANTTLYPNPIVRALE